MRCDDIVEQQGKETINRAIGPLANVYIQQVAQIQWDVSVYGRGLYLIKPTIGPHKKCPYLIRSQGFVITRLRIGHIQAAKYHILSPGSPTTCHHCGATQSVDHMLLGVQWKAVMNTVQLTHWTSSLRQFIPGPSIPFWTSRHLTKFSTWVNPDKQYHETRLFVHRSYAYLRKALLMSDS